MALATGCGDVSSDVTKPLRVPRGYQQFYLSFSFVVTFNLAFVVSTFVGSIAFIRIAGEIELCIALFT